MEGVAVTMGTYEAAGASEASYRHLAEDALRELVEVAAQVEAAAIVERDARAGAEPLAAIFGSTATTGPRSQRLGDLALRLLEHAELSRGELGREPVVQCEVSTGNGHVFVVAAGPHAIIAVTSADPTVGLVFYDLKTALRVLRDAATPPTSPSSHGDVAPESGNGTDPKPPRRMLRRRAMEPPTGDDDSTSNEGGM